MRQVRATVISNEQLWREHRVLGHRKLPGSWLIWLKCPDIASEAKPGQFVMVTCGEECLLPRPFSVHQVNEDGIALFYAVLVDGRGTKWLSQRYEGEKVGLFGPLGNGFSVLPEARRLLMVAGGDGIAPLYYLAQEALQQKHAVTLLYGTANAQRCPVPAGIEAVAATEDGSVGHKGMITDLIPEFIGWADQVFACGPPPMYKAMAQMPGLKDKPVQVSLEVRMGCGRGLCYGCTIRTKKGLQRVCRDGPVFDLGEVWWDNVSL